MTKRSEAAQALDAAGVGIPDESPDIQLVSEVADLKRLAAEESFMQEKLLIRVAGTTDQNQPPYVVLTCNNSADRVIVPRDKPTTVKRMHVEILARMKETRFTQPQPKNGDLESGNYLVPATALAYPFTVLKDPSPAGGVWLDNILAEPVTF